MSQLDSQLIENSVSLTDLIFFLKLIALKFIIALRRRYN